MLRVGPKSFNDFLDYFQYVMHKYFRKDPPIPNGFYLSQEIMDDVNIRVAVARNCHFPSLVTALANDEHDAVRKVARHSEFWIILGRFQDILDFSKKERIFFAGIEHDFNLITLLMFERDLEVFAEILKNPFISIHILTLFIKLLKQRSKDRVDEQMVDMAQSVLGLRKEQSLKINEIKDLSISIKKHTSIEKLLSFLGDDDVYIRRVVKILLHDIDPNLFRKLIFTCLGKIQFDSILKYFIVLTELIEVCKSRQDLNRISVSALNPLNLKIRSSSHRYMGDFFLHLLTKKRLAVVKSSEQDLTNFGNVALLAHCHVSKDRLLRSLAEQIMNINLILSLVNDVSTPKKVFKEVLQILDNHPDENVVAQVEQSRIRESERLKESLKELEITVQAYFDIIFQSLGYNQINEYKNVVRSIELTDKQIKKFDRILRETLGSKRDELEEILDNIQKILNKRAKIIYFDTSQKTVKELEYILSLIEEIFNLKEFGLKSLRPGTPEDIETEIRAKAAAIWRSAISFYLGRIKDLSEMIQKKIAKIAFDQNKNLNFEMDIEATIREIETNYKKQIECNLKIACAVCSRRGCAAERFLTETRYFIKKFLDNFKDQ